MKHFLAKDDKRAYLFLGDLEKQVMEILWEQGALSGRAIYERLLPQRPLALTTILTVLERLIKKGLVQKEIGEKVYLFRATISRNQWEAEVSRQLLLQALKLSPQIVFSTFADILSSLSSKEFSHLMAKFQEIKHEKRN